MPSSAATSLVWFRLDLRLDDNPALVAAAARGPVVPIFLWTPAEDGRWPPGGASRWWCRQSLAALDASLRALGSRLIIRRGERALALIEQLIEESGATSVLWNRRYEPAAIERDTQVKAELLRTGVTAESFNSALLYEPWEIKTKSGTPMQVFTPFWKACMASGEPPPPLDAPTKLPPVDSAIKSDALDSLGLEPTIDWAGNIRAAWTPGEAGAAAAFQHFLDHAVGRYANDRDRPDLPFVSRLSPHLHFGEISPRRIWQTTRTPDAESGAPQRPTAPTSQSNSAGAEKFLAELGWREFAHHLLFHYPHTTDEPLRTDFEKFPWKDDAKLLKAWQQGQTGYPIVNAGMRQLWREGWMHNRVRMIVASFLVKDLMIPWQRGAEWFWDTLVDADLASNTLGWQWSAGCGADAAPFFRIFNPVLQGEKFDPNGDYVRNYVPELAKIDAKFIHQPWSAEPLRLAALGVTLGKSYPHRVVDHADARTAALAALRSIRGP